MGVQSYLMVGVTLKAYDKTMRFQCNFSDRISLNTLKLEIFFAAEIHNLHNVCNVFYYSHYYKI